MKINAKLNTPKKSESHLEIFAPLLSGIFIPHIPSKRSFMETAASEFIAEATVLNREIPRLCSSTYSN